MKEERKTGAAAEGRPRTSIARLHDEGAVVLSYLGGRDLARAVIAWPRAQVQRTVENVLRQGGTATALALALPYLPRAPSPRSAQWLLQSIGYGYRQGRYLNPVYRVAIAEVQVIFRSTTAHWAALQNRPDLILALARSGATGEAFVQQNLRGHTPAEVAAHYGAAAATRALLQVGVPAATFTEPSNAHPLGPAGLAVRSNFPEVLEAMSQGEVDLTARDAHGGNLLIHAAMDNRPETIGVLARAFARRGLNAAAMMAPDHQGLHAASLATARDHDEVIRAMHRAGIPLSEPFVGGPEGSCLHHAARCGSVKVVTALAEIGVNLEAENRDGWTALHLAARYDHAGVIGALFAAGARPDAVNRKGGVTAAHLAVEGGHIGAMEALRSMGANFDLPRHADTLTARALAISKGLADHLPPEHRRGGAGSAPRCTVS